tara:strand:+ start:533 stop:856 length:324 start_codon:yes stop_codon:yes gene_type:complete
MISSYTTVTVKETISSVAASASIFIQHGDSHIALDGLDGKALRGLATMLIRAADIADDCGDLSAESGPSKFSLSYEFEWWGQFTPWSVDENGEAHGRNKFHSDEPKA